MKEDFEKLLGDRDASERRDEVRPFSPQEMLTCEECLRSNPPTRPNCFYCGARLPVTESSARLRKPTLKQPEKWEEGYNIILCERARATDDLLREVTQLVKLEREEAVRIVEAAEPLPLARLNSREEALLVEEGLRRAGLNVVTLSDSDLMMKDEGRRRVRALELEEDALVAHAIGSAEVWRAEWSDLLLLVTGRLLVRRVETEERHRRGASELVETRETTGDLLLLDVYTKLSDGGWRITSDSFDFSCLGKRKGFIASQNFAALVSTLCERAPRAVADDSYNRMRQALAQVWPPEERTESRGLRRDRPGRFNVEAVMTTDNEAQFTRYSRLRHFLMLRRAQSATE